MNKTEEKKMVVEACEKTVKLARESNEDHSSESWCTGGIIEYLQSIFPEEHATLIDQTVKKMYNHDYTITITFSTPKELNLKSENLTSPAWYYHDALECLGYEATEGAFVAFNIKEADNA